MDNPITYAKKYNKKLLVVITGRKGGADSFEMTAKELEKSIQRHCIFYNTSQTSKKYSDSSAQIYLLNGIKFDVTIAS